MSQNASILSAFWQIPDALRYTLAVHEISEIPASFFFLKRLTDTVAQGSKSDWLCVSPELQECLTGFSWQNLRNNHKPTQLLHELLETLERNVPLLAGLSSYSRLAYLTRNELAQSDALRNIADMLNSISLASLSCEDSSDLFQALLDGMPGRAADSVTPPTVRKLLMALLKPTEASTIYDPVCGYASLLCDAARATPRGGPKPQLFGQDLNTGVAILARMNGLLGNRDLDVRVGDTLSHPEHISDSKLRTFDFIFANPSFAVRIEPSQTQADIFHRFDAARPATLEVGIIQHAAKCLNGHGLAAILTPNGLLFRGGSDQKIRKQLLECNQLHAVVALPSHLFAETAIPASVIVLAGQNRRRQDDPVTFIDLTTFSNRQRTQASISEQGIIAAQECLKQSSNQPGICAAVPRSAIIEAEHSLAVSRYVSLPQRTLKGFDQRMQEFLSAIEARERAEAKALDLLKRIPNRKARKNSRRTTRPND